jgi:predicted nucleotidyltransferase component of viral defense system
LILPSAETLARLQRRWPFGLEALETVVRLREVLRAVSEDALLSNRLALKGGTALNLCFGPLPRLSVDLDFNDIGKADRIGAMADRLAVIEALERIGRRGGYRVQRSREEHAGQKLYFRYDSVLGGQRRIEVDVNFLHRLALAPGRQRTVWGPRDGTVVRCLVVSPAELLAGKILALLDRAAPRDLFEIAQDLHCTRRDSAASTDQVRSPAIRPTRAARHRAEPLPASATNGPANRGSAAGASMGYRGAVADALGCRDRVCRVPPTRRFQT